MSFVFAGQWGPDSITGSGGAPLPNDTVTVYESDGVTLATLYTDRTKGSTTANPTAADSYGNLSIFAVPGQYVLSGNGGTLNITVPVDPADVGTASGSGVPIGDDSKVATSIAYTDPVSGSAIKVLTFTEDTSAIALAILGDAFPEMVIRPDTGEGSNMAIYFSDGTYDPVLGPSGSGAMPLGIGIVSGLLGLQGGNTPNDCHQFFGFTNGNVEGTNYLNGIALAIGAATTSDIGNVMFSKGNPNTEDVPGNETDVCWNLNSTSLTDWLWKCTTAGVAGSAVWTAFTGGGGAVSSVSAADGTLTITPTTGAVTAKIPSNVALPGAPTTTTATALDDSTKIATTAYADSAVGVEKTRALAAEATLALAVDTVVTGATSFILGNHYTPVDTTAQAWVGTLPNAPSDKTRCGAKIVVLGAGHTGQLQCQGSDVINKSGGATTYNLTLLNQGVILEYTAATKVWTAISDDLSLSSLDARYTAAGTALPLAGGTMSGPIAMGGSKITAVANGSASSDAAAFGQLPPAVPQVSALGLYGHSYLTNSYTSIPEPQTQNLGFGQKLAGLFHVAEADLQYIAAAGAAMIPSFGPSRAGWDAVLQRVLPPTASGLQTVAGGVLGTPVFWPDSAGQPPFIVDHGVNDAFGLPFGGTVANFTGSSTAGGGSGTTTITSSTNLSSTGTFLAGRVGGNGIQVGDFIQGVGINSFTRGAKVTVVSWSGSLTTLTVQGLYVNTSESTVTFNVAPGQASQFQTALTNCFVAVATRFIAGVVIRSDDASMAYTGAGWSANSLANSTYGFVGGTGPANKLTTTNGNSFTHTIPSDFKGGVVSVVMIGTSDLDDSGCSVSWNTSSSAASAASATTVGGVGYAGYAVPVVARFILTGADAGKTIVGVFNTGSGGTPQLIFDHVSYDAKYQAPVLFVNHPSCTYGSDPVYGAPSIAAAISAAVAVFTGTGTVTVGNVANTYQQFGVIDIQSLAAKRSFWLGTSLSAVSVGTSNSGITLVGQRTTVQGDQQAPYVGQLLVMPDPVQAGSVETMLITAVGTMTSYTIGGNTYNAWPCTLTRGYNTGVTGGSWTPFAVTGSTTSLTNQVGDASWLGPDLIHPNTAGASLFASLAATGYLAVANQSSDWLAAGNQKWVAQRTRSAPRPYNGGYTQHRGTTTTVALGAGSSTAAPVHAMRFVFPEVVVIDRIGAEVSTGAASDYLYAGIWVPEASGSIPGNLLTDFGLASVNATGSATFYFVNGYQVLPAGEYWIGVATNWHSTTFQLRGLTTLNSDFPLPDVAVPASNVQLLGWTNTVPVSGSENTANVSSMVVNGGAWVQAETSIARICVRHWSHAYQEQG